jgi:streptomycin 3"-adenylyltransferase
VKGGREQPFVIGPADRRDFIRELVKTILGKETDGRQAASHGPERSEGGNHVALPSWSPILDRFLVGRYGWADCPAMVRSRIEGLVDELTTTLGGNLVGTYAHGSLATGCFNPRWSDIDILGVTEEPLDADEKRLVAASFLRYSFPPRGMEARFVPEGNLRAWEYPTPFSFYFSEQLRRKYEAALPDHSSPTWSKDAGTSYSMAAHVLVLRQRGIRLSGKPILDVFPAIPEKDYLASILWDFESKKARLPIPAVSGVLNACRVYSYLREHRFDSKEEAAVWAMPLLPDGERKLVARVLEVYRGDRSLGERFEAAEVAQFFAAMQERFQQLMARTT